MTFSWTPHRFVGGALALDLANSVILRHVREKRLDRLADPGIAAAFPEAASRLSAEGPLFGPFALPDAAETGQLLGLREAIDRHFRARIEGSEENPALLADLLETIAAAIRGRPLRGNLLSATARSALRLLSEAESGRMKICGHCGWLFLDRSRNRSRTWCDMSVCGNREKASRHYRARRKRQDEPGEDTDG